MYILLSNLGTGGDIVSAVIDNTDINIHAEAFYLWFGDDRDVLMQNVPKGTDLTPLIEESKYKVLETYYHKFRIEKNTKKYSYIAIDVSSEKASTWVVDRLSKLYEEHELSSSRLRNSSTINKYYADVVITLEDILEGRLIDVLKQFIDTPLDEKLYHTWLALIQDDFPFN